MEIMSSDLPDLWFSLRNLTMEGVSTMSAPTLGHALLPSGQMESSLISAPTQQSLNASLEYTIIWTTLLSEQS